MTALDTGLCVPESMETLMLQQRQLINRKRNAQMFPYGTPEIEIPAGCERYENARGIYHFRDIQIDRMKWLSKHGRENEVLLLGPFSKYDIAMRLRDGDSLTFITEYVGSIELRCAIGTDKTIATQHEYFEHTKEPDGIIVVGTYPERVRQRLVNEKVFGHGN